MSVEDSKEGQKPLQPTKKPQSEVDLERIREAMYPLSGASDDQRRIAEAVVAWGALLLRKNRDYGSSAWKTPVLRPDLNAHTAMLVRMSDKIERINSLSGKGPQVNESLEDTISDLGAYCLLYLACPDER